MSEEKTHHSHDRIFRHAMSLPLVARQFLETWMPKEFSRQQAVVEALEIRFDRVPDGLREEIGHILDSARLPVLHRSAIRCADLESFVKDL